MTNRLSKTAAGAARVRPALVALALGAAAVSGFAYAGDGDAQRCVTRSSIDRTEIVDDGTILFRMRNGDVYRNVLRHECPTLKSRDQFSYRVNAAQLCRSDVITVLDRNVFGFTSGPSCSLGSFEAVGASGAQ